MMHYLATGSAGLAGSLGVLGLSDVGRFIVVFNRRAPATPELHTATGDNTAPAEHHAIPRGTGQARSRAAAPPLALAHLPPDPHRAQPGTAATTPPAQEHSATAPRP
ncbi:MAG: hypothetical protein ABF990_12130 [Acetobacter sp.]|uniref:hypothetical protein n=3 Tax=Acetobacter sp. TaxID=440 RepID=UPI0039EAE423